MNQFNPEDAGWLLDEADCERFWARVNFNGGTDYRSDPLVDTGSISDQCWIWQGKNNGDEDHCYGRFLLHAKLTPAHRIAFRDYGNSLERTQHVDHLCRQTLCVNPSHLEAVSPGENVRRGKHSRTLAKACRKGHEFTEENTVPVKRPNGSVGRRCRQCKNNFAAASRGRQSS